MQATGRSQSKTYAHWSSTICITDLLRRKKNHSVKICYGEDPAVSHDGEQFPLPADFLPIKVAQTVHKAQQLGLVRLEVCLFWLYFTVKNPTVLLGYRGRFKLKALHLTKVTAAPAVLFAAGLHVAHSTRQRCHSSIL